MNAVDRDARPVIGIALLIGAALMLAIAGAIAVDVLPTGGGLGGWVPAALTVIAGIDIAVALFFLTRT